MDNEQKKETPAKSEESNVKEEASTSSKTENYTNSVMEMLNKISERLENLEKGQSSVETKPMSEEEMQEDVFKSLQAQKKMMQAQTEYSSSRENNIPVNPEDKLKYLQNSTDFCFENGVYSPNELRQEFDNPYLAYNRNSYIFRKFFQQTGIKSRFENVEELTRYYSNKNKLNPISII